MGYKIWPPRFLLKGGAKSPQGSFGAAKPGGGIDVASLLGAELTTNGTFGADASWTKDAGWAIAAGVATATATGAAAYIHQAVTIVGGATYSVTYTVTAFTSGNVQVSFDNGPSGASQAATGTFTEHLVLPAAVTEIRFGRASSDFTGSIDNVTLKKIG